MSSTPTLAPPQRVVPARDVHVTGRRVVATILDGIVLAAAYTVVVQSLGTVVWTFEDGVHASAYPPLGISVAYGLLAVLYYVLLEGYRGQTLGKMAVGIEVVDETTGGPPAVSQVAMRTALRLVDGLLGYFVAFVVAMTGERRQRLGDMAAQTLVVRTLGR